MAQFDARDLLSCYARGVFPMADAREDERVFLIDPERRGVIPLDGFHVSRRLARTVRAEPFEIRTDTAFRSVVQACAEAGPGRAETWINHPIEDLYVQLHELGFAHTVECWRDGALVGGLYGVSLHGAFFGESMFSRRTDASKVALVHLVARLIAGGYRLLDAQFMTGHLSQFGAVEISRLDYHRRLALAMSAEGDFQCGAAAGAAGARTGAGAGARGGAAGKAAGGLSGAAALQVISQAA
ncbi:leucyl/phenylalanyl-tRNA--protein transferase [Phenylobacterium sp.]|uniref:leucyl/phenylalanyl-tRNA--protein transferase n=1 Tax=Phenylobacterium sp. TaxID=1871053 RepID=UPI002C3B4408|nr:leucyl/phenylalanyl-tRNA--protein transferase [Phenylobacterium sp.]HLZ77072.1 leucyl/phenylalanyl-tRNA--protein transferase [Phenylobacterium sp.]